VHAHQILGGASVYLAAALARIHERAEADLREHARPVRADVAEELRDDAEWQVVRLDAPLHRERRELRDERPVPADRTPHEAFVREAVEAALLAVARRGGEDEG
jgi:hypothetical protein